MHALRDWHSRLEKHYRQLCESRRAEGGHPLYVLEHGLAPSERAALSADVQEAIHEGPPSRVFYLPWVVYAAELGYLFAGEEYWHTYEDQTPGWVENCDRYWLRDAFKRFAKSYNGAHPYGAWANHFSIICWPITHAILPLDLQRQLAHTLFDLRWVLRIEHLNQPDTLGRLIQSRASAGTSRFAAFTQDALLVGQIAAALLLKDSSQTSHLIHEAALERIAEDLDRERLARTWLTEARQRATQVRLRGVVQGGKRPPMHPGGEGTDSGRVQYQRSTLGIDPRLALRPEAGGAWSVELHVPELQHLLDSDEWNALLNEARCRVAGGPRRPLAPGRLLSGTQRVPLERWPKSDDVLLDFEGASPAIKAALKTTALLPPGPTWLFKLSADGRAYHIRSSVARPGADYFLLSTTPLEYDRVLTQIDLRCVGVYAGRISLPETVPPSVDGVLKVLGVARASSIRIAPVGVPPLFWDGEGHVEWLSTDRPIVAIEREATGEEVELSLTGAEAPPVRIAGDAQNPAYVELPPLPPGTHDVLVRATGPGIRTVIAALEVTVRAPRPWAGALSEQHAVQVSVQPANPSLEELLAGRFRMDVRGPSGLPVDSSATLWTHRRENAIYKKGLPSFRLPFDAAAWHRTFLRDFLDDQPVQNALESAWAIEVQFAFGSLAAQRLLFVRHLSPLRWSLRSWSRTREVHLFDDTGIDGVAQVTLRSFTEPGTAVPLTRVSPAAPIAVPDSGGLLLATHGDDRATAVLAPRNVKGFSALRVSPCLPHYRRAPDGLNGLLDLSALWAEAASVGSQLARMRQCDVLREVHACLVRHLCGSRWEVAERSFLGNLRQPPHTLVHDISHDPGELKHLCSPLEHAVEEFLHLSREVRAERLQGILSQLKEYRDLDVADAMLALQIMSVPERVGRLNDARWKALLERPLLMRSARFLVVATHRLSRVSDITAIPIYVGWN